MEKREREAANRDGANYFELRSKAIKYRSNVLPSGPKEFYIGDSRAQRLLDAKAGPRMRAPKRSEKRPIQPPPKRRGGAANPREAELYEAKQEKTQKLRENQRLFESADGNLKIRKPVKAVRAAEVDR